MQPHQRQAYRAFLIWYGASNLFFVLITTVNLVYQFMVAHLSPLQLVLVGTVLEVTTLVTQIPTGVIADTFSYRRAMILGTFLVGMGFVVEGTFPIFGAIVLAQVIWGTGSTLLDGADAAWLANEVGEEHLEQSYLRAGQIAQAFMLVAIPLSVVLGSLSLNIPIVLGGILMMALAGAMPFFLPDQTFKPPAHADGTHWSSMRQTLRQGSRVVRASPALLLLMMIELFFGLASEGWDRLWQPFFLTHFALPALGTLHPIAWIGLVEIVASILGIGLSQIVMYTRKRHPHRLGITALLVLHLVRIIAIAMFALAGNFVVALIAFWALGAVRTINQPLYDARFVRSANAEVRATVVSLRGLINASGQIMGGPIVGVIGNRSLRAALVSVALLLCPILPLLLRMRRQETAVTLTELPVPSV